MADDTSNRVKDKIKREKSLCVRVADRFTYGLREELSPIALHVARFSREREAEFPLPALNQFGEKDDAGNYRYSLVITGRDGVECRGMPVSGEAIIAVVPEIIEELTGNRGYQIAHVAIPDYLLKNDNNS